MPFYGIFVFLSIIVQFKYMMDSVWRSNLIYAMFGILLFNIALMIIVIALVSIVHTYHLLCNQNYNWWWRSFFVGFNGGVYMLIASIYYMFKYTHYKETILASDSLFLIQMVFASFNFAAMCGTVSLLASYYFVERIYSASKSGEFVRF